jgi:fermentation-respiration switch protein FrsA (DUF1100 family)
VASVIAILLGIGSEAVRRRARACHHRIAYHAAERLRLTADREARLRGAETDPAMRAVFLFDADRHRRAIAWHADREDQFRRAAWRPWQPFPPEPPGPPWPPIPAELYPVARPDPSTGPQRPRTPLLDAFLFHPWRFPLGDWAIDPGFEDVWFRAPDGVRINGWYAVAAHPRAVVLYAEGNAGNITGRRRVLDLFRDRLRCSVLVFDYRGYGRSEGSPSIPGVLSDARAARQWLAGRARVAEGDIVLVGHSLGGAVAVDLAAHDGAGGLVLENTFSSLADVAERHFGRLGRLLAGGELDSAGKIQAYRGPLLQTHGDADRVVPYELGRRLFGAASEPKRFVAVPGGDHNDPPAREYLEALDRFLGALPVSEPGATNSVAARPPK